jgi:hypothetical protein
MSRQTELAVRKRMAKAELVRYEIERALRGDDDDLSRRIRAAIHECLRDDPNLDLNNPDYVEELKAWLAVDSVDFFSTITLPTSECRDEDYRARKAQAHRDLRDYQKGLKRQGYDTPDSWRLTGKKARTKDYSEFYAYTAGMDWERLRRIWSRSSR